MRKAKHIPGSSKAISTVISLAKIKSQSPCFLEGCLKVRIWLFSDPVKRPEREKGGGMLLGYSLNSANA